MYIFTSEISNRQIISRYGYFPFVEITVYVKVITNFPKFLVSTSVPYKFCNTIPLGSEVTQCCSLAEIDVSNMKHSKD
jgi:hypothetical protein